MTDSQHIISILFHIIQAIIALAFLFFMWKWSRKPKMTSEEEHQAIKQQNELADELERQLILQKKQLEALQDMTSIGR
ncbi:hypothetical protein ACXYXE_004127 [Cronobacter dublinensis]